VSEASDPIKAKLEELRKKREAVAAKRDARLASLAVEEQLKLEQLGLEDEEAIEAAEAKHGPALIYGSDDANTMRRIAVVRTDQGVVILERAEPVVWKRYQAGKKDSPEETDKFVKPSLIHPDARRYQEMVEAQPFVREHCALALGVLAGIRIKEAAGK
jgi:hypothetical protein